jgi:ABC-type Na+ efflux pump permease subunit
MTSPNWTRVGAVARKEFTEFRRNRMILVTMTVFPAIFVVAPIIQLFAAKANSDTALVNLHIGLTVLYLMMVPVAVPATVSGYSIVGERDQGTLEPLLTTPISRIELILGKAVSIFVPAVVISYVMFGIFVTVVDIGVKPVLASAVLHAPQLWSGLAFAPLLCGWGIWIGLAISSKVSDTRVAQQLTMLASLPPLAVVGLFAFQVITATLAIALVLGAALLVVDLFAWFFVAKLFDRERLITGNASRPETPAASVVIKVPAN